MDGSTVRWGILGAGRIGPVVLHACRDLTNTAFVSVAARDGERASRFAATHGLQHSYGSYEALLDSGTVDAVYVATPNATHVELAIAAAERGLHVLVEKPFSLDPDEVRRAFGAAWASRVLLRESLMWRGHPQVQALQELIGNARPRHLQCTFTFPITGPLEKDIRGSAALDGGALADLGCYCVSASRLLLGEPEWVFGAADQHGEVDVGFVGVLGYADGTTASFEVGMDRPRRERLDVVSHDLAVTLPDPWHGRNPRLEVHGEHGIKTVYPRMDGLRCDAEDAYRLQIESFSAAVLGGPPLPFDEDDAAAQATVLQALNESAAHQRRTAVALL